MSKIKIREYVVIGAKNRWYCEVECPDCHEHRAIRLDAFKTQDTTLCRSCVNLRRPLKEKEDKFNALAYYRSLQGKASHIYTAQLAKCKERSYTMPTYTRQELIDYLSNHIVFIKLFEQWKQSNFSKNYAPSVDRLDDYKTYSFDNIQIVTWQHNNDKYNGDVFSGKTAKVCTAVDQYDLHGNFIKRWHSQSAAARELKIDDAHISAVCSGKPQYKGGTRYSISKSAGGYIWKYSDTPNTKHERQ